MERHEYGWAMVAIAFTLSAISFGMLSSVGVFIKPLQAEYGWSRGSLSFGYSAITLSTAVAGLFWSFIADKYGTRWIVLFGSLTLSIPLLLLSKMETITEFYLYYLLFGAFGHAAVSSPLYANIGLWFKKNVGLALGFTVAGSAFGQGTVPYIAQYLINEYGWSMAYSKLGTAYIITAIPIALLVRDSPSRKLMNSELPPNQNNGKPFPVKPKTAIAWIASAVLFCCIAMSPPILHLVPLLTDSGISSEEAVTIFLCLMITGAFGRIIGGKLSDQIGALNSYFCMSVIQTIVIFTFPHLDNIIIIYLVAMVFGLSFSAVMASFIVCVRMMVPAKLLARGIAVVGMFGWFGMGLGGWQAGYMFDITGNYNWSFGLGSVAGIINLSILASFYFKIKKLNG
tara:strand:- start:11936 stop:13129 length:1194 start_codon:yes stop_codon:yes gene_type:complete